jgi:hypothetical protein
LLSLEGNAEEAHLARIVAEDVGDLVGSLDRVSHALLPPFVAPVPSASIEHLTESTRNRLVLVACILGSTNVRAEGAG